MLKYRHRRLAPALERAQGIYRKRYLEGTERQQGRVNPSELRRARRGIVEWIKSNQGRFDFSQPDQLEKFCDELSAVIHKQREVFVGAFEDAEEGHRSWADFLQWADELRRQERAEILAELGMVDATAEPPPPEKQVALREEQPPGQEEVREPEPAQVPPEIAALLQGALAEVASGNRPEAEDKMYAALALIRQLAQEHQDMERFWVEAEREAEEARRKSGVEELRETVHATEVHSAQQDEEIERLAAEVKALRGVLAEQPPSTPSPEISAPDFTARRAEIIHLLQRVGEQIEQLNTVFDENGRRLDAMNTGVLHTLAKESLLAEVRDRSVVERRQRLADELMQAEEEPSNKLRLAIRHLQAVEKDLREHLVSLDRLTAELPSIPDTHELDEYRVRDVSATDILERVDQLSRQAATQPTPRKRPPGEGQPLPPGEVVQVEGLPFPCEFTAEELEWVREFEKFIQGFQGQPVSVIEQQLPDIGPADRRDIYNELMTKLSAGTVLHDLQRAIVVLGALRSNQEFKGRNAQKVMVSMIKKYGPETDRLARSITQARWAPAALRLAGLLGRLSPNHKLLNRTSMGVEMRGGPVNQLTPAGQAASQVWTRDLLESRNVTREQLNNLYRYFNEVK